jgi:hypothetical protein
MTNLQRGKFTAGLCVLGALLQAVCAIMLHGVARGGWYLHLALPVGISMQVALLLGMFIAETTVLRLVLLSTLMAAGSSSVGVLLAVVLHDDSVNQALLTLAVSAAAGAAMSCLARKYFPLSYSGNQRQ